MGLDTSHNAWHGPYTSFGDWRRWLAGNIGIRMDEMVGFGGAKEWTEYKSHPLYPLLDHSDCDGQIELCHLAPLAVALIGMADQKTYDGAGLMPHQNGWYCIRFAKGCLDAMAAEENIEFR